MVGSTIGATGASRVVRALASGRRGHTCCSLWEEVACAHAGVSMLHSRPRQDWQVWASAQQGASKGRGAPVCVRPLTLDNASKAVSTAVKRGLKRSMVSAVQNQRAATGLATGHWPGLQANDPPTGLFYTANYKTPMRVRWLLSLRGPEDRQDAPAAWNGA